MFLLGITRAPTWMEERFLSLTLLRHILLRFRLIFPVQILRVPAYLRGCSSILCVNSPRPLGVYRP